MKISIALSDVTLLISMKLESRLSILTLSCSCRYIDLNWFYRVQHIFHCKIFEDHLGMCLFFSNVDILWMLLLCAFDQVVF